MAKNRWRFGRKRKSILPESLQGLLPEKMEDAIRAKLDEVDLERVEKLIRRKIDDLDWDKLEAYARDKIDVLDRDKIVGLLRSQLGDLDLDKLRVQAEAKLGPFDQRRLVKQAQRKLRSLDSEQVETLVKASVDALVMERLKHLDTAKLEALVRARIDALELEGDALQAQGKRMGKEARKALKQQQDKLRHAQGKIEPVAQPEEGGEDGGNALTALLGFTSRAAVVAAVGWIAYSYFLVDHHLSLPKAIPADQTTLAFQPTGPLSVYRDIEGQGRPLVLLHSINAAASAYEMRPLFQHFRGHRPTYALDLPGFGFSARAHHAYTPDTFIQAIVTLLEHVEGGPADVVALSLTSEFAAEVARRRPDLVHSLTLISPTGFSAKSQPAVQSSSARGVAQWLYPLLKFPLWSRALFDFITTRRNIEQTLQKMFVGEVTPGLVDYDYVTAHQPGAEHAPLAFISGRLFAPNAVEAIYSQVQTPTLVLFDRDPFSRFERLPDLLAANRAWRATRIVPTLGLPHFERLDETTQALDQFWESLTTNDEATST